MKKVNVSKIFSAIFCVAYIVLFFNLEKLFKSNFNALYYGEFGYDFAWYLFDGTAKNPYSLTLSIIVLAASVAVVLLLLASLITIMVETNLFDKIIAEITVILSVALFTSMLFIILQNWVGGGQPDFFNGNYGIIILPGTALLAAFCQLLSKREGI